MDAIIPAAGMPRPGEPLYEYTRGRPKALLDVAGKPMVQWVLDAMNGASLIDRVILVGLEGGGELSCRKPLALLPDQGSMVANILAGTKRALALNPAAEYVLVAFSDIPTITGEMVDWVVASAGETGHSLHLYQVTREVMEARFPGSKRRYDRLTDLEITTADLNVAAVKAILANAQLGERFASSRKNPLRVAAVIGFDTLLYIALGRFDTERLARHLARKFGIEGRFVICPYAEVSMDVDQPHHLQMVRADLSSQLALA